MINFEWWIWCCLQWQWQKTHKLKHCGCDIRCIFYQYSKTHLVPQDIYTVCQTLLSKSILLFKLSNSTDNLYKVIWKENINVCKHETALPCIGSAPQVYPLLHEESNTATFSESSDSRMPIQHWRHPVSVHRIALHIAFNL